MWPGLVIVPGSSTRTLQDDASMANADEEASTVPARDYTTLHGLLTAERLGSYLRWSGDEIEAAFALYEWNMSASAALMHTTGMVEVVVRGSG
jgi:hypothetical protein